MPTLFRLKINSGQEILDTLAIKTQEINLNKSTSQGFFGWKVFLFGLLIQVWHLSKNRRKPPRVALSATADYDESWRFVPWMMLSWSLSFMKPERFRRKHMIVADWQYDFTKNSNWHFCLELGFLCVKFAKFQQDILPFGLTVSQVDPFFSGRGVFDDVHSCFQQDRKWGRCCSSLTGINLIWAAHQFQWLLDYIVDC